MMLPEHEPNWLERLLAPIMGPALWIIVLVIAFNGVSGCVATSEAESDIARKSLLAKQRQEELAAAQRGEVIFDPTPYYGSEVIVEKGSKNGKALPSRVEGARGFTVAIAQRTGLNDIARLIEEQTGIPVNIRTKYLTPDGKLIESPITGKLKTTHQGALSKFLDYVSARLDIGWAYDGTSITFDQMLTETYRLPIPLNAAGDDSDAANSEAPELWKDVETLLKPAIIAPATFQMVPNTGRVRVFGPPSVQSKAREIIEDFDGIYGTRIGLEVGILFVDVSKADDFGVGISGSATAGNTPISFLGGAGAITGNGSFTISPGNRAFSFKALAQDDAVVDSRHRSTIVQSGVTSVIDMTTSANYVKNTSSNVGSDGTVSNAIETASLDTGILIHARPRLIDRDQIQLSLRIKQNDLVSLDTFSSGTTTAQLPVVTNRGTQNEAVLSPGETLIISGYEQELSSDKKRGVGNAGFLGLGGSRDAKTQKVRMVIFVRASLIPNRG